MELKDKVSWFVGAHVNEVDRTEDMLNNGVWYHKYEESEKNKIHFIKTNDMKKGDLIAIKSTYTRKNNTPFDTKGIYLSVMGIKNIGIITEESKDGKSVKVDWNKSFKMKEWYFFTMRDTVWNVKFNSESNNDSDNWMRRNLMEFTFNNVPQNIEEFRNYSFWVDRFATYDMRFNWIKFYKELSYKLLDYENNREELLSIIDKTFDEIGMTNPMIKGGGYKEDDICPFTFFATFNRGIKNENKIRVLRKYKEYLNIKCEIPENFNGIPEVNNMSAWFYGDKDSRKQDDIENIWKLYKSALELSNNGNDNNEFIRCFDVVKEQFTIGVSKLTIALYWINPEGFLPLDSNTKRTLIKDLKKLNLDMKYLNNIDGYEYLNLNKKVIEEISKNNYKYDNLPELSYRAWLKEAIVDPVDPVEPVGPINKDLYDKYNFLDEVFIDEKEYEILNSLIKRKKNMILQGSPGVGKTFAAKRLAYSILGSKDDSKIKTVQFHQNYSYEDFLEGYRPKEDGGFALKKGPFYEFCKKAQEDKDNKYFFIIDEINRGNLSKIFGELMVLIEEDKRGEEITLVYSEEEFSVPDNLYIIGMMNTADRSIAIIDYALRRRFVFFELSPAFNNDKFKKHLELKETDSRIINEIIIKFNNLNAAIEEDLSLGSGFKIGHSYFCNNKITKQIYEDIIQYEIGPLISEYWFDNRDRAQGYIEELIGD